MVGESGEASGSSSPRQLLLGAPVSLTGRYALMGRLAAVGLWQVVGDVQALRGVRVGAERLAPALAVVDDQSTREGVRRALDDLAEFGITEGARIMSRVCRESSRRSRLPASMPGQCWRPWSTWNTVKGKAGRSCGVISSWPTRSLAARPKSRASASAWTRGNASSKSWSRPPLPGSELHPPHT
jgi:hypothetical protein